VTVLSAPIRHEQFDSLLHIWMYDTRTAEHFRRILYFRNVPHYRARFVPVCVIRLAQPALPVGSLV
jgi:hypothetical protein